MKLYYHKNKCEHNKRVKYWNTFFRKHSNKLEKSSKTADIILAVGGDGTFVNTVKKYAKEGKTVLGINAGTRGFLANNISDGTKLFKDNFKVEELELTMLKITINGKEYEAFNEVSIGSHMLAWIDFKLKENNISIADFKGSGVIVSTPQGSTGINRNCGGAILPLEANSWSIVGDKTNKRINHTVLHEKIQVNATSRNKINVWIDGEQVQSIDPSKEKFELKITQGDKFKIAFLSKKEFLTKRRDEII